MPRQARVFVYRHEVQGPLALYELSTVHGSELRLGTDGGTFLGPRRFYEVRVAEADARVEFLMGRREGIFACSGPYAFQRLSRDPPCRSC